ncbi:MAG: phenylacetate-CoA oxygenase subunit PaaJ [Burkholderiales bacterium]|nr:phenylacetate-CoA oxygenase subunit PaaJ [Burkholderiales bacterium]
MAAPPYAQELVERAWAVLGTVADPEIPVISVVDLGIVRSIEADAAGVAVAVTPTYAACPATEVIARDISEALAMAGIAARLTTRLSPPWTTDWITPAGRARLREFGIAPPGAVDRSAGQVVHLVPRGARMQQTPPCPQCGSASTELLSQFASTACKALYRCLDCREPFDYFKPL